MVLEASHIVIEKLFDMFTYSDCTTSSNPVHSIISFISLSHTDSLHFKINIKMAETRVPNKLYSTHPKNYGKGSRQCRVTGRKGGMGLIRKYGIDMKRQAFRERARDMGWEKYS